MKRLAFPLFALTIMLSLAACGARHNGEEPGVRSGNIGDTLSTEWFDFVVDEAYSCAEYHGYTPSEGCRLVVAAMSLKNNCGQSVDVWGEDFALLWGGDDDASGLDIPLPAGISGDQFPDRFVLDAGAVKSGVLVFEAPEEFRDFSLGFMEIFDDGGEGGSYFVDFTAGDRG